MIKFVFGLASLRTLISFQRVVVACRHESRLQAPLLGLSLAQVGCSPLEGFITAPCSLGCLGLHFSSSTFPDPMSHESSWWDFLFFYVQDRFWYCIYVQNLHRNTSSSSILVLLLEQVRTLGWAKARLGRRHSLEEIFHPLNVAFWCRRTTNRNSGPDRGRLQKVVNHPFKLPSVRQHPWVTGVELSAKGPAHQCNIFQLSILQDDEGRLLSIEGRICPEAELGLSGRSHPGSVWNSENRAILIKNQNRPLFGTQKYSRNPKKIDFTLRNNKLVCYSCFWSHCSALQSKVMAQTWLGQLRPMYSAL